MSTRFFHESNFAGLIEKVRQQGRASSNQKMAEQFNRLFNPIDSKSSKQSEDQKDSSLERSQENICSGNGTRSKRNRSSSGDKMTDTSDDNTSQRKHSTDTDSQHVSSKPPSAAKTVAKSSFIGCNSLHKRLSDSDMVANNHHNNTLESKSKKSSAPYIKDSKSCSDIKSKSVRSSGDSDDMAEEAAAVPSLTDENTSTSSMCAVLCSMMKVQLLKTYDEVLVRFGGHFDMSNIDSTQVIFIPSLLIHK